MAYKLRTSSRARHTSGKSFVFSGRKPAVGTGARFSQLKSALARKGARNPGALAAYIGRKKYGSTRFARLSAAGRRRG